MFARATEYLRLPTATSETYIVVSDDAGNNPSWPPLCVAYPSGPSTLPSRSPGAFQTGGADEAAELAWWFECTQRARDEWGRENPY